MGTIQRKRRKVVVGETAIAWIGVTGGYLDLDEGIRMEFGCIYLSFLKKEIL